MFFSKNGDSPAKYELINLQKFSDSTTKVVTVGYYDASLPKDQQLTLNGVQIVWKGESTMVFPVKQLNLLRVVILLQIAVFYKIDTFIY